MTDYPTKVGGEAVALVEQLFEAQVEKLKRDQQIETDMADIKRMQAGVMVLIERLYKLP